MRSDIEAIIGPAKYYIAYLYRYKVDSGTTYIIKVLKLIMMHMYGFAFYNDGTLVLKINIKLLLHNLNVALNYNLSLLLLFQLTTDPWLPPDYLNYIHMKVLEDVNGATLLDYQLFKREDDPIEIF